MIKKNFIKIIFIFLLAGCGYSPMLSSMDNKILNIEVVAHEGDKEINQVLRSKLKFHKNNFYIFASQLWIFSHAFNNRQ